VEADVIGPSSLLLVALLVAAPTDDFVQRQGQVEARLRLDLPDEGAGPGRARVRLDVEVTGPEDLEVDGPRLEDSLAAWRVTRRWSSWRREGGRCVIATTATIEQVKPGVVPLPGVVVRARESDRDEWHELTWDDLLRESREGAGIQETERPPPSPWPGRLGVGALVVVLALAAALVVRRVMRRKPRPVPAYVRALAYLGEANVSPARAELVVRDYLDERFGLATRRQTAREMLGSCSGLPEEARRALEELSGRAELVKYAGVAADEAERLRAIALARQVIESCATLPVGQEGTSEEKGETGAAR
jgi:hypothetical protein